MKIIKTGFILVLLTLLIACSEDNQVETVVVEKKAVNKRVVNLRAFSRGQKLYLQNCAQCHGKNAEGTPDWRNTEDDGMFPPPPLNGTGHTWHHSTKVLVNLIKNGTAKIGGKMPAWKDKLSDQEIDDILTWVKAQWPDEVYAVWYTNNQDSK